MSSVVAASESDRTIGSSSLSGGAGRFCSGEGRRAGGRAVSGVDLDPITDSEDPAGVEDIPADGILAGTPLGSLGPEGAPEGAGAQKYYALLHKIP